MPENPFGDPPSEHDRGCRHGRVPRPISNHPGQALHAHRRTLSGGTAVQTVRSGRRGYFERPSRPANRPAGGLDDDPRPGDVGRRPGRGRSALVGPEIGDLGAPRGTITRTPGRRGIDHLRLGGEARRNGRKALGRHADRHAHARFRAAGAGDLSGAHPVQQFQRTWLQRRHRPRQGRQGGRNGRRRRRQDLHTADRDRRGAVRSEMGDGVAGPGH